MPCCQGNKGSSSTKKTQAISLVLSVANVLAHALRTGKILASKELVEKRIEICKNCRHLEENRCNVCGCFINLKAGLRIEKCPLKLW